MSILCSKEDSLSILMAVNPGELGLDHQYENILHKTVTKYTLIKEN